MLALQEGYDVSRRQRKGLSIGPTRRAVVWALRQYAVVSAALELVVPRPQPSVGVNPCTPIPKG